MAPGTFWVAGAGEVSVPTGGAEVRVLATVRKFSAKRRNADGVPPGVGPPPGTMAPLPVKGEVSEPLRSEKLNPVCTNATVGTAPETGREAPLTLMDAPIRGASAPLDNGTPLAFARMPEMRKTRAAAA